MDLSRWSMTDYHAPLTARLLLKFGGHPHRCEYCRTNFVSFRRRKERYRSGRHGRPHSGVPQGANHGLVPSR